MKRKTSQLAWLHLRTSQKSLSLTSGSTDDSCEIAQQHDAKVLQFDWNGKFPKKRNWVLQTYTFSTPWVLFLDADESINQAFVNECRRKLATTKHNGFWLNYQNYFMGKALRHGDSMRKIALFRVGHGTYEKIEENAWSELDMEIHEHPIIDGTVGSLQSPIIHNEQKGLHHYIAKHNEYSSWEAKRTLELKKS